MADKARSRTTTPPLSSRDLLEMEERLCHNLAKLFAFSGHSLYFPVQSAQPEPRYLPRERRLLLPLTTEGRLLGVFMARGVRAREIRPLLPVLPGLIELCLANLTLAKAARTDRLTSLATENALFAHIERRAARVREFLEDAASTADAPLHSLCFGLVFIRLVNGEDIARQTEDYIFTDNFLRELARACAEGLPPDVLPARVGRHEFALLIPGAGRGACEKTARDTLERMRSVCLPDPLSRRPILPVLCAGYAVYPQDMRSADMVRPMYDQARRLLARAAFAAEVARNLPGGDYHRVLAFARILHEGGVVREVLSGARLRINLGQRAGAVVGLRFAVHAGRNGAYKGEIVLLRCDAQDSVAELLHVTDAVNPPAPGDVLSPLAAIRDVAPADGSDAVVPAINLKGICGYGEFLKGLGPEMGRAACFTLVMLRFEKSGPHIFAEALQCLREAALQDNRTGGAGRFTCGHYGETGLVFFHPGLKPETLLPCYSALCAALQDCGPAAGLAGYPFLHFSKAEIRDCALKALDYALLLPEPRAGICNSLALNISADRLYSQGDLFAAMEEYKLALLADKNNVLALNSLGVCLAALGRREEARRYFTAALKHGGKLEGQTCYNLGAVCQILGRRRAAAHYYRRCLACEPEHLFAHIRLGQLYETGGKPARARAFYERVMALEDARGEAGPARRFLAGVMARGRRPGEARELLRESLTRNPEDAAAMLDMARLYLNGNESPELAEMFASRSLAIHDCPVGRQILAEARRALKPE